MSTRPAASVSPMAHPQGRQAAPPAWRADALQGDDWLAPLPAACVSELLGAVARARAEPLPTLLTVADDFELDACRALVARLRARLEQGTGVVVLDRLPMQDLTREDALLCYWLLASLLARPVAQTFAGAHTYDVRDRGLRFSESVRASVTTDELGFHSDNAYGDAPPDLLGLLCLQTARSGGVSRLVSLLELHDHLLEQHAELLERCYRPFLFSQGTEHGPGARGFIEAPIFGIDAGGFRARLHNVRIQRGYHKAGVAMDVVASDVLDAIDSFLAAPGHYLDLHFAPGQMQFVNNRIVAHMRTAFEDWPEDERKRHLIRLWLRDGGRRSYNG